MASAASSINFSFSSWLPGTKLLSVIVCETWGSSESRCAIRLAASRFGAMSSIALTPVWGSFRSSRKVATDSALGTAKVQRIEVERQKQQ
jgi:hypothetical protein